MPKNATINTRIDGHLKAKAEKVLRRVGVGHTDLITMLYHQVVERGGIPFEVKIPNKETRKAMAELDAGKSEVFRGTSEQLFDHITRSRK